MTPDLTSRRELAFAYSGESIVDWATRIDEFERNIYRGDDFEFSLSEVSLNPNLLRKLRLLSIADFEVPERTTDEFRQEAVHPLLNEQERRQYRRFTKLLDYLKSEWAIQDQEIEATESGLISFRWLIKRQSNQRLNRLLHQAFDFVQLCYDHYWLDISDELWERDGCLSDQFDGIFERYRQESNAWLRFTLGYVIVDLVDGRELSLDHRTEGQIKEIVRENAVLRARWTRRVRRDIET